MFQGTAAIEETAGNPSREDALRAVRSALPEKLRGRVRSARELSRAQRREEEGDPFSTALEPLDRLLDGGLSRGRLVELVGRRSGGRLSILLTVLAAVTAGGEAAALVDLGGTLDPLATESAGVDLERLLWVRPRRTKEALIAAEILLEGGFPLVTVDFGMPPVRGGRGAEAGWLRLARQARERRAALLVSSPYRVSGTAAATVLTAVRGQTAWCRGNGLRKQGLTPLLTGLQADLTREKHRGAAPGMQAALAFHTDHPWATERLDESPAAPLPFVPRAASSGSSPWKDAPTVPPSSPAHAGSASTEPIATVDG